MTNTFDDTVKVDSPPWPPQALLSYVEDRDLESLVFPFQPGQFRAVSTATCASRGNQQVFFEKCQELLPGVVTKKVSPPVVKYKVSTVVNLVL